jgi:RND superfamily putative drug exporter
VVETVRTAGRTIVFSAGTVAVALAALLIFPMFFLRSFAYAGIGVVVLAALAALLVTPALLTVLGKRINAARLPWSKADRGAAAPFWGRLASAAMRRPLLSTIPVIAALLLIAGPLLKASFGTPDEHVLTDAAPSRQVADTIRTELGGAATGRIDVVVTGLLYGPELGAYAERLSQVPGVDAVSSSVGVYAHGTVGPASPSDAGRATSDVQELGVTIGADQYSDAAEDLVRTIRTVDPPPGSRALVGGVSAQLVDTKASIASRLPAVAAWIVVTTFLLLFLFTGSVVQPLRALVVNGLSIVATLGVMTWMFQDGHFASVFGFTPRPMDTAVTVLLFCITFGLCMDYEVFVTSRIRELHEAGHGMRTSVAQGLARTGRIVSTAAGLMAVNFFAFGTSTVSFLQMFGLGAGLAVLIDATVVRGVLVPAVMRLAGPAIWYAPRVLRRLHGRVGLREG